MQVFPIYNQILSNFSYLILGNQGNCFCIDPTDGSQILEKLQAIKGKLRVIINTHEHFDHIQGNKVLEIETGAEVWAHSKAKKHIPQIRKFLDGGEKIEVDQDSELEVIYTPGHTIAHISLLLKYNQNVYAVFSGDTVFNAGVGNCYNGGDSGLLYNSISKYFVSLPNQVLLYPGHDYLETNLRFTLANQSNNHYAKNLLERCLSQTGKGSIFTDMETERKINLFFQCKTREEFIKYRSLRDKW